MTITVKDPFAQPHAIALYKSLQYGWSSVSQYYGPDKDASYHTGSVRISEPEMVKFTQLANEEAIKNAVGMLDAEELKVLAEMNRRIAEIREQRQGLLAITYQPEVPA
jgi:hypothetical protein